MRNLSLRQASVLFAALSLPLVLSAPVDAKAKRKTKGGKGQVEITWLGHAAFQLVSPQGTRVLIDPFLKGNPATPEQYQDLSQYKPDLVLVTHSHQDHMGQAVELAERANAPLVTTAELSYSLKLKKELKKAMNVGGQMAFKDVTVHVVPAMHGSSPGGRPVGFVLEFANGPRVYHSGDTWIFSDMKLIQEIHKPGIILLNTGGGPYTQSPEVAALAIKKYFKPKHIIPMHFGTFPPLADAAQVKKAFKRDRRLKLLKPGDTVKLGR